MSSAVGVGMSLMALVLLVIGQSVGNGFETFQTRRCENWKHIRNELTNYLCRRQIKGKNEANGIKEDERQGKAVGNVVLGTGGPDEREQKSDNCQGGNNDVRRKTGIKETVWRDGRGEARRFDREFRRQQRRIRANRAKKERRENEHKRAQRAFRAMRIVLWACIQHLVFFVSEAVIKNLDDTQWDDWLSCLESIASGVTIPALLIGFYIIRWLYKSGGPEEKDGDGVEIDSKGTADRQKALPSCDTRSAKSATNGVIVEAVHLTMDTSLSPEKHIAQSASLSRRLALFLLDPTCILTLAFILQVISSLLGALMCVIINVQRETQPLQWLPLSILCAFRSMCLMLGSLNLLYEESYYELRAMFISFFFFAEGIWTLVGVGVKAGVEAIYESMVKQGNVLNMASFTAGTYLFLAIVSSIGLLGHHLILRSRP